MHPSSRPGSRRPPEPHLAGGLGSPGQATGVPSGAGGRLRHGLEERGLARCRDAKEPRGAAVHLTTAHRPRVRVFRPRPRSRGRGLRSGYSPPTRPDAPTCPRDDAPGSYWQLSERTDLRGCRGWPRPRCQHGARRLLARGATVSPQRLWVGEPASCAGHTRPALNVVPAWGRPGSLGRQANASRRSRAGTLGRAHCGARHCSSVLVVLRPGCAGTVPTAQAWDLRGVNDERQDRSQCRRAGTRFVRHEASATHRLRDRGNDEPVRDGTT
jgi:hypothetical protein